MGEISKSTYAGVFTVSLAILMYEILLTRIFSVTMWYHFAFMAVSIALFGLTVGALAVYLLPQKFTVKQAGHRLSQSSLLFSITMAGTFRVYLLLPAFFYEMQKRVYSPVLFGLGLSPPEGIVKFAYAILTEVLPRVVEYFIISVPFIFAGVCITVALTKFPKQISRMYAVNLAGSALGCILVIYALEFIDAPTAVIVVAGIASVGSVIFSHASNEKIRIIAMAVSITFLIFVLFNAFIIPDNSTLLPIIFAKGHYEPQPLYEKWNSYARITVYGDPEKPIQPFAWGLSKRYNSTKLVKHLSLKIDTAALTLLTEFDGDANELDYLGYDVTNLVHHIRPHANIMVIGSGGGRDILSALYFNQSSVVGIEINQDIIDVVNNVYGDFTGHLDRNPKVSFVADEARSYITRREDRFDIIQISLIDTWAATAAGAYVLTENSLYTVEAWKVFLEHLTERGVLSVSRWYMSGAPGEIYRLTSLATKSLLEFGIEDPREHIVIVKSGNVGTMLVGKQKFTSEDLDRLNEVTDRMDFDIVLSPRYTSDENYTRIASSSHDEFVSSFPLRIDAPTDNSPFFFNMLRLRDVFDSKLQEHEPLNFNMRAIVILATLLFTVCILTLLCIIIPMMLSKVSRPSKRSIPFFLYFACIGLGFMLVEISQMNRLIIFLGHPTYSLSVVLFSLLLSSGAGSYATSGVNFKSGSAYMRLLLLLTVLVIFGLLTPYAIDAFRASTNWVRIAVAVLILLPLGFFMGMAFPLGMKAASAKSEQLTPWLWGVNGATSVLASILAFVIAFAYGITASFWTGVAFYVIAFASYIWFIRR